MIAQNGATSDRYRYNILVDRLDRLAQVQNIEYRLIVLDFRYTPFASSATHTSMAMHMVREGMTERGGEAHGIGDHYLFCLTEAKNQDALKRALQEVFALTPGRTWGGSGDFLTSLHLKNDVERLKQIVGEVGGWVSAQEQAAQKAKARAEVAAIAIPVNGETRAATLDDFATARFSPVVQLEFIEEQLPKLKFQDLVRSQPIGRYQGGELVEVAAQEFYASIVDLQKRFSTSIDMVAHYLLRHHLVHNLGQLLLNDLHTGALLDGARAAFVQLQVATLKGAAFKGFDEALGELRPRLTLELEMTDVLAHVNECREVIAPLRDKGFGIGLTGVSLPALEEIEIDRLPLSALKLDWQSDTMLSAKARARLDAFQAMGGVVVLGRTIRKDAVAWGEANGISHFQGVVVDEAAGNLLQGQCSVAEARKCSAERCRNVHWAPHRAAGSSCPRPLWTSPKA